VTAYGNSMCAAHLHEADRTQSFLSFEQFSKFPGNLTVPVSIQPFHFLIPVFSYQFAVISRSLLKFVCLADSVFSVDCQLLTADFFKSFTLDSLSLQILLFFFSLQPSAFSLQPFLFHTSLFSLQPSAFSLFSFIPRSSCSGLAQGESSIICWYLFMSIDIKIQNFKTGFDLTEQVQVLKNTA